jgi:hypothetical protein
MDSVRSRATVTAISTPSSIGDLLRLAGVSPSNKEAAAWLNDALESARASYQTANRRPQAADHNALLADIEKSARELTKRIERLRRHPASWSAFWRCSVFRPIQLDRAEVSEVLSTLAKVMHAADNARDRRKGRQREVGKQHVVDRALGFFVRFSAHRPSGTRTGAFAAFARAFCAAVTEVDRDGHDSLDRQIRQAVKRLPIERQRAQRKSIEKPRDSS